jgi:hypothetical protein
VDFLCEVAKTGALDRCGVVHCDAPAKTQILIRTFIGVPFGTPNGLVAEPDLRYVRRVLIEQATGR